MQRVTLVRYKVKPEFIAENEALSKAVFNRVNRDQPQGIAYGLFREEDGQSFLHVFVNRHEDNSDAVTALPEFDRFQADISARCEVPPQVSRLSVNEVHSFGFPS